MNVCLIDETGSNGIDPWAEKQKFYSHGCIFIENFSIEDTLIAAEQCKSETGLKVLHMSGNLFPEKMVLLKWVSQYLMNKEWYSVDYHIQKEFYPGCVFSDLAASTIRWGNGTELKNDERYNAAINLLANVYFDKSLMVQFWQSIKDEDPIGLRNSFSAIQRFCREESNSYFCKMIADACDRIDRESDPYHAVINSKKFSMQFKSFKSQSFLRLMKYVETKADNYELWHERCDELIKKIGKWKSLILSEIPIIDRVRFSQNKEIFFIIDAIMWASKEYHSWKSALRVDRSRVLNPVIADLINKSIQNGGDRLSSSGISWHHYRMILEKHRATLNEDNNLRRLVEDYNFKIR